VEEEHLGGPAIGQGCALVAAAEATPELHACLSPAEAASRIESPENATRPRVSPLNPVAPADPVGHLRLISLNGHDMPAIADYRVEDETDGDGR
jgi:hypothetical protein